MFEQLVTTLVEALVKPELLIWARDSAGFDLPTAAKKIGISQERLESWESGLKRPTVSQLRKTASVYKRPIAVFYLQSVPSKQQPVLHDFRRIPSSHDSAYSPSLAFEIRRAQHRRQIALDLYKTLEEKNPVKLKLKADLQEDPSSVASRIRDFLGISFAEQTSWRTEYDALNAWKTAIEEKSILIFQASRIDVAEMRGFSISAEYFPVIVLNSKDSPLARIFTLIHELTHIVTNTEGVCDFHNDKGIEVFCNAVAGSTLLPFEDFISDDAAKASIIEQSWTTEEIRALANKFKVSKQVLIRRLLSFNYISAKTYNTMQQAYETSSENQATKAKSIAVPQHTKAIATSGKLFTRLVLSSYNADMITGPDASDFLSVKIKHLPQIESAVYP